MDTRYKIIISNKNLYREIELAPDSDEVKIGTGIDCGVRLRKELFFGKIELSLNKIGKEWKITCSDNIYLTVGDIRKLVTKTLHHGESVDVRYQNSDIEVFNLSFTIDFDYEKKIYDTRIDISGQNCVVIGGSATANIRINDELIGNNSIELRRQNGTLMILDHGFSYGVYVNGTRISGKKNINEHDFFSIASYSFYYKRGRLYTAKRENVTLNGLNCRPTDNHTTHFEYPNFIRNTRVQYCIPEGEIEIPQPIPKPQKSKKNLLLTLIPSVTMLILMVVLRGMMSTSGGMFVIYSACSMGIGVIMSIVTYRYEGREYKKEVAEREASYREYIANKEREIVEQRQNELRIRNLIYESLVNSINEVRQYGKRLFEKSDGDKDFLEIYLGRGTVESNMPVKFTKQEFVDPNDPISLLPEELEKKYRNIENAPIVSRFNESCGVGVVGKKAMLNEVLKNITLDLAIRHFYKEVKTYYVLHETDVETTRWVRWLRHTHNDGIGIRNIMCDDESRKILLENLYSVLSEREAIKKEHESQNFDSYYVVFVLDSATIRNHPISKYIEKSNEYGFTFVFFEEYEEFIPKGCTEIIRLDNNKPGGGLLLSQNGDIITDFAYEYVPDELAESVALKLGAITVEEVSLESALTKNISMYQLLNILAVDDLNLKERWESSQVYRSMAAPLGVKTKNEVVYLDISDRANAHGPHGLVAGTTGSGKSEILQTYVLSMATLFHPYDVGFVIIDFKGGGMANQFKNLPHMMGAITNIDGREINRSLLSIKAELVKRQSLFAQAGVNHINDYIRLYKRGTVRQPLPHLIIIVDEFAELKAEYPDFMKELISAARIGRTLGVHLILATQKPAGVVDAQIWSNSKFKLCLKVQTKEDSNEVIKTPLAAEIIEPGRAYFQVGNNEIFELFQSAYSGVKVSEQGDDKTRTFSIYELNRWGKRTLVYTNKKKSSSENAKNQLQTIVEHVANYFRTSGRMRLSGICLPPLEDVIKKTGLSVFKKDEMQGIVVPVGIFDDPERQEQSDYRINLSENNVYIIGSAMTGKTTLLQTMLMQMLTHYTPSEANVYIIDCGSMTLKVFENSNIVGGVAIASEEAKVVNLFKMLFRQLDERKKIFAEKGLGTHKAYIEAGYKDLPQIVLMIDNLAVFKEYYDNLMDDFLELSREGNSLGLSIVATAAQTNAMNYKAMSNYGTRIAFVCNDSNEYMNLFDRCRIEPKDTPGRGLCMIDKRILEFQTALCVDGDKEFIRVENMRREIALCNRKYPNESAAIIPVVPDVIRYVDIKNMGLYKQHYKVPLGINYGSIQYEMLDISTVGMLAVLGKERSGKTNFIRHILTAINANIFDSLTEAYVIDNLQRTLGDVSGFGFVKKYTFAITELEAIVEEIETILHSRQERAAENENYKLDEEPLILLVIENYKLWDYLAENKEVSTKLVTLVKQLRKYKFAILISDIENAAVPFTGPEFIKFLKENRRYVAFDELANMKLFDVTVKQVKEHSKPLELGDAFICNGSDIQRIKTIYVKEEE